MGSVSRRGTLYFWAANMTPTFQGITVTPAGSLAFAAPGAVFALLLGLYGWGRPMVAASAGPGVRVSAA